MCYTSPTIRSEVKRIVKEIIGPSIKAELDRLKSEGKAHLLSGVTVTSEPSLDNYSNIDRTDAALAKLMAKDKAPKVRLGYCALTHLGYGEKNPPKDFEQALVDINRDWGQFWAEQFVAAGIPSQYLYTHVAAATGMVGEPGADLTNAPLSTAFNKYSRPGFTTYPVGRLGPSFDDIYKELEKNGRPPWGGVEATLLNPAISWKEYLSRHYDHGAAMVNIMGFYEGAEVIALGKKEGPRGDSALSAFRSFLRNESLAEQAGSATSSDFGALQARIHKKADRFNSRIHGWVAQGGNPSKVQSLMQEFQRLLQTGDIGTAETKLDEALAIIDPASEKSYKGNEK